MRIFSVARLTEDRFPKDRETDWDSCLYHKFLLGKQVQNQTFGKKKKKKWLGKGKLPEIVTFLSQNIISKHSKELRNKSMIFTIHIH